jgi:glycerol kinase
MHADSGIAVTELRVDGGATQNDLLMQFQADVLGVPVVRPKIYETTALGAAYLAGLAVGFWKNTDALAAQWQLDRRFEPAISAARRAALKAGWIKAVKRSRAWAEAAEGD